MRFRGAFDQGSGGASEEARAGSEKRPAIEGEQAGWDGERAGNGEYLQKITFVSSIYLFPITNKL